MKLSIAILASASILGCATVDVSGGKSLIVGASISSGWAGKPAPELFAESLHLSYRNEASICHDVADDRLKLDGEKMVINIDGFYHGSYRKDCAKEVEGVEAFFAATKGVDVLMATVPLLDMGALNRMWCGSQMSEQVCRSPINAAIKRGCIGRCKLIDADDVYSRYTDQEFVDRVHLRPEVWKAEADRVLGIYGH